MRNHLTVGAVILLMMFLFLGTVQGAVLNSSCTGTSAVDVTCYVAPSDGLGNYSGESFLSLPAGSNPTTPGYLVLLFPGDPSTDDNTVSDWEQVVEFLPNTNAGTGSTELELFTNGCFTETPGDTSCFPTLAAVQAGIAGTASFFDDQCAVGGAIQGDGDTCAGPGVYNWYPDEGNLTQSHQYFIYTVVAATSPEPASTGLILIGFIGIFASSRWIRRAAAGQGSR